MKNAENFSCGDRLAGVKNRTSMRCILKGNRVGDRDKLVRDCRFKTRNFRHKKGRKKIN